MTGVQGPGLVSIRVSQTSLLPNHVAGFNCLDFVQAANKPLLPGLEICLQKCLHQFRRQRRTDDSSAQNQNVHVVMFDALVGRVVVMAHGCADARHLVGGNADSHAAAAYQDPTLSLARLQSFAHSFGEVRIIRRLRVIRAQVSYVVTTAFQVAPALLPSTEIPHDPRQ